MEQAGEASSPLEVRANVLSMSNRCTGANALASTLLRVERVGSRRALVSLRTEWTALAEAGGAEVFSSWEWLCAWLERIGKSVEPWLLAARTVDGVLVGLMPLALERRSALGRQVRRLGWLGDAYVGSDYLDVISAPGIHAQVVATFADYLLDHREEWDVLDLLDVEATSPTLELLSERMGRAGQVARVADRFLCPYERFEAGETFETFLRRTGRRDNYLRRRKWLEKQPGFTIDCATAPGALPGPMAEFLRLHALRWAKDGGSQGIRGPSVEAFHRDATQLLAERGKVRLYTMRVGGEAVASVYALVHGERFLYFQSGYDPAWRSKSVGLVLVGETFRDAFALGCREYDFLRGTETYKSDWVTQRRRTLSIRFHAPSGAGAWFTSQEQWAKQLRNGVKAAIPQDWTERIRRWRRRQSHI